MTTEYIKQIILYAFNYSENLEYLMDLKEIKPVNSIKYPAINQFSVEV